MNLGHQSRANIVANTVLAVLASLFVVAGLFPEKLWGFNHFAFLPNHISIIGIGLFILSCVPFLLNKEVSFDVTYLKGIPRNQKLMLFLLFALLFGQLYDLLPIYYDIYGDAFDIGKGPGYMVTELNSEIIAELTSLDFKDSKIGERTSFFTVYIMSYFLKIDNLEAFELLGKVCGMIWVFTWLLFCEDMLKSRVLKVIAAVVGILAPFSQIFYHHYEIYALGITMMLVLSVQLAFYLKYKQNWRLIVLGISVLLSVFTHILFLLWLPILMMLIIWHVSRAFRTKLTMKRALLFYLVPAHIVGILAYFFVFKSYDQSRNFDTEKLEEAVFLPITSNDPAPLDQYYLFDFAHLLDFFNVFFIWSIAAIFMISLVLIKYRSQINWNDPTIVFVVSILIPFISFFFVFNPLLGMEADWDLFSLPAPIILCLMVVLLSRLSLKNADMTRFFPAIGFAVLGFLFIIVNSDRESLSKRYESSGKHLFKTYYIGASTTLHGALHLCDSDKERHLRRVHIIESLKSSATKGNDIEYADMLCEEGLYVSEQLGDKSKALAYFEEAATYSPFLKRNALELGVHYAELGMTEKALAQSELLLKISHPSREEAYKRWIHYTLLNEDYEKALLQCKEFLAEWPDSRYKFIGLALNVLESDTPEDAINLFKEL